uniref:VP5 n=1 Tax=Shelly beach virus TaxID=2485878 RepID=A0A3G3BTH3_9VIRU|nr:VP5 [Shelly beach virus]
MIMTLKLWNYLENSERYLLNLLPNITPSPENDLRKIQTSRAFGRRLERLYLVGKSKFHPVLLRRLERSDYCGIYIYSKKSKEQIVKRLHVLGWSKNMKIHFIKEFPRNNYFDQICMFDVVVFNNGAIPTEVDVYCLHEEERSQGRKSGVIQQDHSIFLLDRMQNTFIGGINPFRKNEIHKEIIGIGGQLKGFPDWYKAFEKEATLTLFDANDQPILSTISKFYTSIGCYIPNCTNYFSQDTKYWHAHHDPTHPRLSLQNFRQATTHTLLDFGCGYNILVKFASGNERRFLIPIELYDLIFAEVDSSMERLTLSTLPESSVFLFQSPNGKHHELLDSEIVSTSILSRANLRTLEYRRNLINVFQQAILERLKPNLVLISPKGTLKTTFLQYLKGIRANIGFIDSDEFGKALSHEYFKLHKPKFAVEEEQNFTINWFRAQFPDFEIPITEFDAIDFERLKNLRVSIEEFSSFWKNAFDKGYGDVPSFYNFINQQMMNNSQHAMTITMTHNIFEARLCQSKMILTIDSGLSLSDGIIRRAIQHNKTVSQFLADELYQRYCLSSSDLHTNVIGWGDLMVALLELGVAAIVKEQV